MELSMRQLPQSVFFSAQRDEHPPLRAGAGAAKIRATKLPLSVRLLLFLTTNRWRAEPILYPDIAGSIERLIRNGWTIRTAFGRNFLLWRHGRVQNDTTLPVLVLPSAGHYALQEAEANAFIATELVRSGLRVDGVFHPNTAQVAAKLDRDYPGFRFVPDRGRLSPEDLHARAERKIVRGLA
jgi:hypothetical protein